MIVPSPCGMTRRDSCLQPETRNFFGASVNVFEDVTAPNEPTARSLTDTHCEPVSLNKKEELERNTQIFAMPTPRFARKFSTWNPPSPAEGPDPQNCLIEQSRNQVSVMHSDTFPDTAGFQCWKTSVQTFPRTPCCGSKK